MTADGNRPQVRLECESFDVAKHRAGTNGAAGRCSWREDCPGKPSVTARVTYLRNGRRATYALCDADHLRLHQYFDVQEPGPVDEAHHLLSQLAEGFARGARQEPTHALDPARVGALGLGKRGLLPDESRAFLRTWRAGLVEIEADGAFTLPRCRECPPALHLVGRSGSAVALHTEYLIHIGAVAELVNDYGWHMSELAFEQGEWDIIGVRDGRPMLLVEAKARAHRPDGDSLESLRESLHALSRDESSATSTNHRNKFRELRAAAAHGPVVVLLVASDARWWMEATVRPDGLIDLADLAAPPT
jgi:Holliday junction resolvase-like predicted endonuclease